MARDHHPGDDASVFLGEDLLAWLVLAIGAALAVGNALALIRPPETKRSMRFNISIIGPDLAFFSMAHTPAAARGATQEMRMYGPKERTVKV